MRPEPSVTIGRANDSGDAVPKKSGDQKPEQITNSIGMSLKLIPAGEFLMGSPNDDKEAASDEKPQHRVRITHPFFLGVTEVTRGQFRRFVESAGYRTEAERDGKGAWGVIDTAKRVKAIKQHPRFNWLNPGFRTDRRPPGGERDLG